jgi:hypothetical protein
MTRATGRYEREIANGPALSSRGRSNTSISLLTATMKFVPRVQQITLLPRRTATQALKIE